MSNTRDVLGDDVTFEQIVEGTITSFEDDAIDSLRSYAFYGCQSLTSVSLPACTSVGGSAFQNCYSLASVSLPVCTSVSYGAFKECSSLTSISLPACTSVAGSAFYGCSSLASVSLPVCTSMGSYVFRGCRNLVSLYLTSVSAVPTLQSYAFDSTPIGGYSASAGQYGSVYVPAFLYSSFITANRWSSIASRIVSVA